MVAVHVWEMANLGDMADLATMEALAFSSRGAGLVHNHPISSTSRMRKDLWSRGALLLLLQCRQETGSQDSGVLGGRAERHQGKSQWCHDLTIFILDSPMCPHHQQPLILQFQCPAITFGLCAVIPHAICNSANC